MHHRMLIDDGECVTRCVEDLRISDGSDTD